MTTKKSPTRLYRIPEQGKCMGVCAGIADYFDIRLGVVRVLMILGALFTGIWPFVIGYFIVGFILEPKPRDLYDNPEEEQFWRETRAEPDMTASELRRRFRDIQRRTTELESFLTSRRFKLERELENLKD